MPGKQSFEYIQLDKAPVADTPSVLKDTVIDYGVPDPSLYLARDNSALQDSNSIWINLGNEQKVVPPRRHYQPNLPLHTHTARAMTRQLLKTKDLTLLTGSFLEKELLEDNRRNRLLDHYDPYKSNILAVGQVQGRHFWICPMGVNSTQLGITFVEGSTSTNFTDRSGDTWQCNNIPQGRLEPCPVVTFSFPILQIEISRARSIDDNEVIVGVRTFDGASLISIKITEKSGATVSATLRHRSTSRECGISRLNDMAMSPYNPSEYAVIDDAGYVAFFGCESRDSSIIKCGIINEHISPSSSIRCSQDDYWQAITFGPHPRMVIVACAKKVQVLDLRQSVDPMDDTFVQDNELTSLKFPPSIRTERFRWRSLYELKSDERIYALNSPRSPHSFQCCIVTTSRIILLDTRYPARPILTWAHHMDDNPPTSLEFQQSTKNRTFLFASTPQSDKILALSYCYNGISESRSSPLQRPASQSATYSMLETVTLDSYSFQQTTGLVRIPTTGIRLLSRVARCGTKSSNLIVVYRLFSDDALHIQPYIRTEDLHAKWRNVNFPRLTLNDSETQLKRMQEETKERSEYSQIWQPRSIVQCLVTEYLSLDLLPRQPFKPATVEPEHVQHIVQRAKQAKCPVTIRDLVNDAEELEFNEQKIQAIDTLLKNHLTALSIESIPFNKRPCLPDYLTSDPEAASETAFLNRPDNFRRELLTRELTTSELTYVPTRNDSDDNKLRYLLSANERFHLTPTTKLLAQEWPVGLGKGELLSYGQQKVQELFPQRHKKRLRSVAFGSVFKVESEPELPPSIAPSIKSSQTQNISSQLPSPYEYPKSPSSFTEIASQPVSGAFASRAPVKKKKKKKVLGFK